MQPQQDEMWIEVLEKLLGITAYDDCHSYGFDSKGRGCMVPSLTLDALYECEKKLTEEQQAAYLIELKKEAYGGPTQIQALYHICASKEQRLLALWRTITQRSPVDATP
jgi:hypothetical protein